jgi:hypothetical protein
MLTKPRFLIYFSPEKILFLNLDASVERGFAVMVFHLMPGVQPTEITAKLSVEHIQPVIFISKLLSTTEKRYHATELEVAGLVWACRKLRPMIQSSNHSVIVLTDYTSTRGVYERTNLNTSDVSKANMRLVHASVYLSQFDLDVRYYPGRLNIVPDILLQLKAVE